MTEGTSLDQFRNSLRNSFARRLLGFETMTDAEAEWITGDEGVLRAYYDRWSRIGGPTTLTVPAPTTTASAAAVLVAAPTTSALPHTAHTATIRRQPSTGRGALIFVGVIVGLILLGLMSRGFAADSTYPAGCTRIEDGRGGLVEC